MSQGSASLPPIVIKRDGELFTATAESERLGVRWSSPRPMHRDELVRRLLELGFHPTDVGDALFFADPSYLANEDVVQRHPDLRRLGPDSQEH